LIDLGVARLDWLRLAKLDLGVAMLDWLGLAKIGLDTERRLGRAQGVGANISGEAGTKGEALVRGDRRLGEDVWIDKTSLESWRLSVFATSFSGVP